MYYGAPAGQQPLRVPESALQLVQELVQATDPRAIAPTEVVTANTEPVLGEGPTLAAGSLRGQLATSAKQLYGIVDDGWRKYLALPSQVFEGGSPPPTEAMQKALAQYDRVVQTPKYEPLAAREEFQSTYGLLREYVEDLSRAANPQLPLPPPPAER
jgi:hypothetical protein